MTKYVAKEKFQNNRSTRKWHADPDCSYMHDAEPVEVDKQTVERYGLGPCVMCAGGLSAHDLRAMARGD